MSGYTGSVGCVLPTVSLGEFAIHGASVSLITGTRQYARTGSFTLGDYDDDIARLFLSLRVNDVKCPTRHTVVDFTSYLAPMLGLHERGSTFVRYLVRDAVYKSVMHEVDEWLRIDGELVTDPHPKVKP